VAIIGAVSVRMMQADVNAKVNLVILRVPPTGVDDLVCIGGGVNGAIGNAVVHAIVTIVIDPVAEAVRPVAASARVADSGLGWRRAGWRRGRTIFTCSIPCVREDKIILCIVGRGMIEDRFLRGCAGIRRIEERRDLTLQRERTLHRGAAHTEEGSAEQEGCQCILKRMSHGLLMRNLR
jgi:hypothetical protein